MSKIIVIQIICLGVNRKMRIENAFKHFNDKFDKFSHHINKTAQPHSITKQKEKQEEEEENHSKIFETVKVLLHVFCNSIVFFLSS